MNLIKFFVLYFRPKVHKQVSKLLPSIMKGLQQLDIYWLYHR